MTFSPVAPILSTEELILTNFRREKGSRKCFAYKIN